MDCQIFVISHDDEKYAAFMERLPEVLAHHGVTRIEYTPETAPAPPDWWECIPVAWVVVYAHLQCHKIAETNGKHAVVFEQDAVFHPDFETRFREFIDHIPDNADQAYIGGQLLHEHIQRPHPVDANPYVLRGYNVHRAHAYITFHNALRRVIDHLEEPFWNCTQVIDWRLGYLHMQPDFHVYIPAADWMCGQAEGVSAPERVIWFERWFPISEEGKAKEAERELKFRRCWLRENMAMLPVESES